jgi:ATP-binding cassette subfamily C protein CydC
MRALLPFIRLLFIEWRWLSLGAFLGLLTLLAGMGLLSLSGWFIAATAYAGLHMATAVAFNYFLPSGGVRLFSMTRIGGRYGDRVFTHEATFRILKHLRLWVYKHLEPLAPAHLLNFRGSELLNRLVSDVDAMDNLYIRVLTPIFLALIVALALLVFLLFINVALAWLVFAALLFSGVFVSVITLILGKKPGAAIQKSLSELRVKFVAQLQGMLELKIFHAYDSYSAVVTECSDNMIKQQARMSTIKGLATALMALLAGLTMWLALFFGVQYVHASLLNGALLALVVLGVMAAFEAVLPIPLAFQYLGKTITAAKRLLEIANATPAVSFPEKATDEVAGSAIAFADVSFAYAGRSPVFEKFNLNIKQGEKLGVVGPTGCGKTTLVHLLSRCWDPQQGEISIGGVDLKSLSEDELRAQMTVVSQRPYIFNESVRKNLLLAKPGATDEELFSALEKVQLADFIKTLPDGLSTLAGEFGVRLSGGQLRRLALARAVLYDAPIWILDEPTEGLDVVTREKVLAELEQLTAEKTVIIVSHRLADLRNVDRVLRLS